MPVSNKYREGKLSREMTHTPEENLFPGKSMALQLRNYMNNVVRGEYAKQGLFDLSNTLNMAMRAETPEQKMAAYPELLNYFGFGGMTAFHGSPHLFNKFSLSKIGTGEGAQAYGHGLYFAENPKVAGEYQSQVKDIGAIRDYNALMRENVRKQDKLKAMRYAEGVDTKAIEEEIARLSKDYQSLMDAKLGKVHDKGHLYEVDIPDKYVDNFLDLNKQGFEQPDIVQKAMRKSGFDLQDKAVFEKMQKAGMKGSGGDGMNFLRQLEQKYGKVGASEYLNSLGIKGIKYFDQASRGAGEGTRNLVVFDDSIVKILKRE